MLVVSRSTELPSFGPRSSYTTSSAGSSRNIKHERHSSTTSSISTIATTPRYPQSLPQPSIIERLPSELERMVLSHLDYQSLIFMSSTSRHFHHTIHPQRMAHPLDKAEFVMRAARDFPQHRPSEKGHDFRPGNFECYICFRVRSPNHFDTFQPQFAYVDQATGRVVRDRQVDPRTDRQVHLRRFCIECGVKEGLHAPFDCLTTKTGCDLWVCLCRRVWSKPGHMKCRDCGADCPLRPRKRV